MIFALFLILKLENILSLDEMERGPKDDHEVGEKSLGAFPEQ